MGLFSSDESETDVPDERVEELVNKAKSDTVTEERLTKTDTSGILSRGINLEDDPLVDYLNGKERVNYVVFNSLDGARPINVYDSDSNLAISKSVNSVVGITDERFIVILSGLSAAEGDVNISIPFSSIESFEVKGLEEAKTDGSEEWPIIFLQSTDSNIIGNLCDITNTNHGDFESSTVLELVITDGMDKYDFERIDNFLGSSASINRGNLYKRTEGSDNDKGVEVTIERDSGESDESDTSQNQEKVHNDIDKIDSSEKTSSPQQAPQSEATNSEERTDTDETDAKDMTSDTKFCPSCGAELDKEWDFCMDCGEDVSSYNLTESTGEDSSSGDESKDEEGSQPNLLSELNRAEFKHQIQQLSPYEFEEFIGEIWSELGWETEITKGAQDRGIDVVAQRDDRIELIQVKRYAVDNKVGSNEIRKYATLYQQESEADSIALVTASSFTSQAEELASDLDVRVVDSDELYDYIQEEAMDIEILSETSDTGINQESSSADEFVEIYEEFTDLNKKMAKEVMTPASNAADYDGAEAAFARSGNREQLRFAIEMRNEWAEIINELEEIIPQMEGIPDKIPHAEFARLISEQIQSMRDLSEAYQRGLTYKDKLINTRFESTPINPGELTEVEVPDAEILSEPQGDVEDLKHSQDVAMTIAAKETDKIGDFSDERRRIIESVADNLN